MKKLIFALIAFFCSLSLSAQNQRTEFFKQISNPERYELSIDIRRLEVRLDIEENQMDAFEVINENLENEISAASDAPWYQRRFIVRDAVFEAAHQLYRVLDEEQFSLYMQILGATLCNKHL